MTFPVLVERENGQFVAQLVGEHAVRVVRATREEALAAIQIELQQLVERGELLTLDLAKGGAGAVAGRFSGDPTLQEICDEIYVERDRHLPAAIPLRDRH